MTFQQGRNGIDGLVKPLSVLGAEHQHRHPQYRRQLVDVDPDAELVGLVGHVERQHQRNLNDS